jgi:DNA-directed RNA polymerase specialized sigma subunit
LPVFNGTKLDDKILSFCYFKARKVSEIAKYLGVSVSSYLRKNVLENLVKHQYLEKSKISRTTYFKTNRDNVDIV